MARAFRHREEPEVLEIVRRLPVDTLKSGDAALIIGAAVLFFEDELGRIQIENPEQLRAVVTGMIDGLNLAGV
jgi:hypothetical protein